MRGKSKTKNDKSECMEKRVKIKRGERKRRENRRKKWRREIEIDFS